jgi:hypothetical protein
VPKKTPQQQSVALQWSFAVQMLYHPLMGAIRASIIMFLFRMKDNRRRIRYSLHVVFWLNILYTVGTTFGNIFQCNPVRYTWMRPLMDTKDATGKVIPAGTCIDSRTFVMTSCALSIFMDIIIIPIPSIMVWNLNMTIKTKALVVIVMSLGWIATAVSVGRLIVYYYRFAPTNTDRTWDIGIVISIVEPCVHIVTACAPATKSLFRFLFPSFASSATPIYYEDRNTTGQGSRIPKGHMPRGSRGTTSFRFGLSKNNDGEEGSRELRSELGSNNSSELKGESVYGMKRLDTSASREETDQILVPERSCVTTIYAGDPNEHATAAEPKHVLGRGN